MEEISGLPVFAVEFDKEGAVVDESAVTELLGHVTAPTTDLIVLSHGWNNDKDDAAKLCKGVPHREGRILMCLKNRQADLGPACAGAFKKFGSDQTVTE